MGKKILDSKLLYALLAIVIAIGLWFYVAVENSDVEKETEITGVPINFVNVEILEENNLMISKGYDQTATLTVVGASSDLVNLQQDKEKISLTIDVSKITSPGEQLMAYSCTLPSAYQFNVQVTGQSPSNVAFTVSRRIDREIPIIGDFDGTVAEGYMRGVFEFLPAKIGVTGIESDVNKISHALVVVDGDNLTTSFEGELPFKLIDYQGEELTDIDVALNVETVAVTLPIIKTAEVPLTVKWLTGGGVTDVEKYVQFEIDPSSIIVSGDEEDLKPLKEIYLGEIDLSNIIGSDSFEFEIPLNDALENISGITRATVDVTIAGLESKVMEVDNIQLKNVPEGFDSVAVTKTLQVLVRGTEDAMDLVLPINLRAVADLSDVDSVSGRYTVPVEVYLDGTRDAGVVGDDYKIVVDIIQQ